MLKNWFYFVAITSLGVGSWSMVLLNQNVEEIKKIQLEASKPKLVEDVVDVVGRCDIVFDGLGATSGLVVKTGTGQEIVRQDELEFDLNKVEVPKQLLRVRFTDGNQPVY